MSAIAGIYYLDGRPVERADLGRMVDILAHRGPDGAGVWSEGPVGLGHRMLWTTPESLIEQLPLGNQTGDLVITADARIDNRDELIAALGLTDRPSEKITDSQLILSAYERWGESCPEHLLGDFAFVIWDGRKKVLFCARDHFGVKPFYYYSRSGRAFVFASEIKALLCLPEVPRRLNETKVADYLYLDEGILHDDAITFYQEILRLPPAHSLTVSKGEARQRQYWFLDPTREIRYGSDEEYAEAYREIFTNAVSCRLRSAFPVGSTLSGGLDSSSITCVARKLLAENGDRRLHTFSAIYDDVPECDERPFINTVLAQGNLEPHYVHPDQLSPLADLDRVFWHEDEVFYAPNLFMHWACCRAAHQQGVRIFLDGFDGDTIVSHGIAYLTELARREQWHAFAIEANGYSQHFKFSPLHLLRHYGTPHLTELARGGQWLAFARQASCISKYFNVSSRNLFLSYGLKPLAPKAIRKIWRVLRGRLRPTRSEGAIINPDFAERIGLAERIQTLQGGQSRSAMTSREHHYHLLTSSMHSFILEVMNKSATAFSIEPRHPFFDRRLIEFCLALPPEQKLDQGWNRIIARRALVNVLPEEVRWRGGKTDVSPVFARGLLMFERERLENVLLNEPKMMERYVDMATLRNVYQRYVSRRPEDDAHDDAHTVWLVVSLALWLRSTGLTP